MLDCLECQMLGEVMFALKIFGILVSGILVAFALWARKQDYITRSNKIRLNWGIILGILGIITFTLKIIL